MKLPAIAATTLGVLLCSTCIADPASSDTTSATTTAGQCDEYVAAMTKLKRTPHREISNCSFTSTKDHVSGIREEIFTGDALYSSSRSGWSKNPTTGDLMAQTFLGAWHKDQIHNCFAKGSETIEGQVADVILLHSEGDHFVIDSTFWISKSSLLILKSEMTTTSSFLNGPTEITDSTTYEYDNVIPPSETTVPGTEHND
jgi:hypothetical protein